MDKRLAVTALIALGTVLGAVGVAAPKLGPRAKSWQFDVRFHDPKRLVLRLPGEQKETTFWYVLYEVMNATGRDRQFYPSIRLVTDTLQVVEAGADIHPGVYDLIAERHKQEFPFFAHPGKVMGLTLQGRENARSSAAVFRDFDFEASSFTIYASGFAGDVERVINPTFDVSEKESNKNQRFFTLRRTLAIRYDLPGDAETRGDARPVRRTREWVMR